MEFLSTPSARRATSRLPSTSKPRIFLSTPSARRATRRARAFRRPRGNFYPRPPRGGRPRARQLRLRICCISIHALREEGDGAAQLPTGAVRDFYPRPPRGGRLRYAVRCVKSEQFLSTPSARRATWIFLGDNRRQKYFYPRPPRGGRPRRYEGRKDRAIFLSTPSARRATYPSTSTALCEEFLSTPSARRATIRLTVFSTDFTISIHALREEGDCPLNGPASPASRFLSTPSARRATR